MACSIFKDTYVNCKRNKEIEFVTNKHIHVDDQIQGYSTRPSYKKVLDVFEVNIKKERQRTIILENGIELVCSDNHALICRDDGILIDVFPDDLNDKHAIITTKGATKVKHVYVGSNDSSTRFLDIIVEDHYYFCGSDPEKGLVLCYN